MSFGTCSWLMSVYARDILSRLPQLLATCTAIFGNVLKIDSTKKVSKKLQGTAAGSASWCTNIGNERGEVIVSVLTESEGLEGLRPWPQQSFRGLPDNIVAMLCSLHYIIALRYQKAKQDPPQLLYTDRDCCSVTGPSKCAQLFAEWNHLQVSRHFDPSIMMMQLAGETGCIALHAKACTWL